MEFENTERLIDLHAEYGIPACFAIVGAAALDGPRPYHDRGQIRRIHEAGHEIASHSFHHDWIPGLGRIRLEETLKLSKEALEQCIGAPVISFVPPYNQPFDYPQKGSFSVSERRQVGRDRISLRDLCLSLANCGYRFSRVSYRPLWMRLADRFLGLGQVEFPTRTEQIAGITCIRTNTRGGFDGAVLAMLRRCVAIGGIIVVCGHPHSLHAGNSQDEIWLLPFLQEASRLRREGQLRIVLPRELIHAG